jgi:hypothetical protein
MKIRRESPESRPSPEAFTLDVIKPVRDFTARKTLEQAHAFVTGLTRVLRDAESSEADGTLLRELQGAGIGARDAEQIAAQALSLIALMEDRDRKAEVFHAAVKEAGQGERAMYERLAALAQALRARLGGRSPALAKLGVPPEGGGDPKIARRPLGKAVFSAVAALK